ncbi:MAG: glycosyltransferase family 9 protein [Bacteroidia bacterium]
MKALIIQTAFIGDVILATPVISELHRCRPDLQTDVLVRKGNESLLDNFAGINRVLTWDKKTNKNRNLFLLLQHLRDEQYDLVINLQRFLSTGLLTAFGKASEKIGFDKNPMSFFFTKKIKHRIGGNTSSLHETQRNLRLIEHLGASLSARPVLFPSQNDYAHTNQYKKQSYVCIAPTSVWFTKQVPNSKWAELLSSIRSAGFSGPVYLLGGPADASSCQQLINQAKEKNIHNLAGKLSFLETAALMKDASMNYVNDSAPMHIASSMNAPVTVFYCSTIPAFGFGPLSDKKYIHEVSHLPCRPCGLHGYKACPERHFKCAFQLDMTVNSVHINA